MLFDLRGRGRRRVVQVIYVFLAVLMGGGLVFFGIGGGGSGGGLLDAFTGKSKSASDVFQKRVDTAQNAVRVRPKDAVAWQTLAKVRYQQASADEFDANQGLYTDKGKAILGEADAAWTRTLTLTDHPDPNIARLMVQVYASLNDATKAIGAFEVYLPTISPPTAQLFVNYATLAYQAGQTRKAELASRKALKLSSVDDREQIKAQLDAAKKAAASASTTSTPATTTTG
jgi:tetratricopeptide (TPR) repeat protein